MKKITLFLTIIAAFFVVNTASAQLFAEFQYTVVLDSCDSWEVAFTNTSVGTSPGLHSYLWQFGNGNFSSQENPPNQFYGPNSSLDASLIVFAQTVPIDTFYMQLNLSNSQPTVSYQYTSQGTGNCNTPAVYTFSAFNTGMSSPAQTWLWEVNGLIVGQGSNLTYTMQQGTYVVTVYGSNAAGCAGSYSEVITVNGSNMTGNITYNIINSTCNLALVDLFINVAGGTAPYTYQWNWYDFGFSNLENPQQVAISSIDPNVYLTVTDASGCTYNTSTAIQFSSNVILNPVITANVINADCFGTEIQFLGTADPSVVSWEWVIYDGFQSTQSFTTQNPIATIQAGPTGNFVNAVLTVTDANGCTDITDFAMTLDSFGFYFDYVVTPGSSCSAANCDATITINPVGGMPPYLYSIGQGAPSTSNVFTNVCDGNIEVRVEDANGCVQESFVWVNVQQNLLSLQSFEYYESCNDSNVIGNGSFIEVYAIGGTQPYTYLWSDGTTSQFYQDPAPGSYSVVVTDGAGCSVSETFIVPVNECFTISGSVYVDNNGNCMLDGNDYGLSNTWVDLADANGNWLWIYDYTDANGYYEISVPAGTYFFDVNGWNVSNYNQVCPAAGFSVTLDANNIAEVVDFFLTPPPPAQDLSVSIGHITNVAPSTVPGQNRWSYITYCNDGTIPMSGSVVWNFSPELTYDGPGYTNIVPDVIDAANSQLIFHFTNLQPGQCEYVRIDFDVPNSMQIGTVINDEVIINPIPGDVTPANNTAYSSELSVGSWDPNDKAVYPAGDITEDQNDHSYHIRFQNEGNANATRVIIRDELDDDLVLHTLRNVNASHSFVLTVENDNELVFTFDNIQLPPKDVDEAASQGYVAFTITQVDDLPIGTEIENTAAIYFDFNEAVITNTVVNKIVEPVGIIDRKADIAISLYPNPTTGVINVASDKGATIAAITVYDIIGNVVFEANDLQTAELMLNLSDKANGMYMLKIETDKGTSVKRFVTTAK